MADIRPAEDHRLCGAEPNRMGRIRVYNERMTTSATVTQRFVLETAKRVHASWGEPRRPRNGEGRPTHDLVVASKVWEAMGSLPGMPHLSRVR